MAAAKPRPAAADRLTGTPASAGTATGKVRVIMDPVGAHLEPGEILVAPSTDPGWTPLFMTAGALVMEMGGVISHGAVVAREYGIPAVVGVADATTRLRDGQTHHRGRGRRNRDVVRVFSAPNPQSVQQRNHRRDHQHGAEHGVVRPDHGAGDEQGAENHRRCRPPGRAVQPGHLPFEARVGHRQ